MSQSRSIPATPTNGLKPVIAIIQARMSSSRLPGKVLLPIAGEPMLVRVVERAHRARLVSGVVVATTDDPSDDALETLCSTRGYPCYRGSLHDVLDRYYQAAQWSGAGTVVRITADCPVIDPALVDATVQAFFDGGYDFTANRLPPPWGRTYPIGLDTEVVSFANLQRAWNEAHAPHQREHVMPYFYENGLVVDSRSASENEVRFVGPHPAIPLFRCLLLNDPVERGEMRWTVDTPADLELLRQIYARFPGRDDFSWTDILALLAREPDLASINQAVQHKAYTDVDDRR